MKKNMGTIDRVVRIIVAVIFAILCLTGTISGVWSVVLGIIAVILFITSLIGFCPAYALFNISTIGKK